MKGDSRKEDVERLRREKDRFFRESPNSPLRPEDRRAFQGLEYFPYNEDLVLDVKLHELDETEEIVMATSLTGKETLYYRVGYFTFQVDGSPVKLYAYRSAHEHEPGRPSLFIPFRDRTSGRESYGAGRYMDIQVSPSGKYVLDLNLAYNPYCAYSEDYICPLPPGENWLKVDIRAGEKDYKGH